jgi:LPXTG-motif cell wall-anchored protein
MVASASATPAWAANSHPGGLPDTCPEVLSGSPTGDLEKSTDPADGSDVQGGDVVTVTLRWDPDSFDGPLLHKVLDCVTVGGQLAPDLSGQERDAQNDGSFEWRFTVPTSVHAGQRICDRGFVSGPGSDDDFERQKSNDVCFTVGPDDSSTNESRSPAAPTPAADQPAPSTDAPTPPVSSPTASPPTTPDAATPAAPDTSETSPARPAPGLPGEVEGPTPRGDQPAPPAVLASPHEAPAAPRVPHATLPATGASPTPLVLAGLVLCAGGLSIVASAGRRRRPATALADPGVQMRRSAGRLS